MIALQELFAVQTEEMECLLEHAAAFPRLIALEWNERIGTSGGNRVEVHTAHIRLVCRQFFNREVLGGRFQE